MTSSDERHWSKKRKSTSIGSTGKWPAPSDRARAPEDARERRVAFWQSMAYLTSIGWLLAIPIAAGVLMGHYIDVRLGSGTQWTLALLGAGLVVGALEAYLAVRRFLARRKDGR